jgi:hypothetical protein
VFQKGVTSGLTTKLTPIVVPAARMPLGVTPFVPRRASPVGLPQYRAPSGWHPQNRTPARDGVSPRPGLSLPPYLGLQRSLVPDMILEFEGNSFIVDAEYKRHWEEPLSPSDQAELPDRGRRARTWLTTIPMSVSASSVATPFGAQIRT